MMTASSAPSLPDLRADRHASRAGVWECTCCQPVAPLIGWDTGALALWRAVQGLRKLRVTSPTVMPNLRMDALFSMVRASIWYIQSSNWNSMTRPSTGTFIV